MARQVTVGETDPKRRRVYFQIPQPDGITPALGEDGEQPEIMIDGDDWTDVGIGVLVEKGNGRYYADLTEDTVSVVGRIIETRYKSINTAEAPGDSIEVVAVGVLLQDDAIDDEKITAAAANKLADHNRRRHQDEVEDSAHGDALSPNSEYGNIQQAQKSEVDGDELRIYKTDGALLGTRPVTSTTGSPPITGVGVE